MSTTLLSVNDAVLMDTIGRTENRLVFIAPGLRPPVANASAGAIAVVPHSTTHLALDVDAEISRLGYGDKDFQDMEMLQAAAAGHGLTVNRHPGIRIGLLIADETTLIYSPTAESIETENQQPDKPNAILLQVGTSGKPTVMKPQDPPTPDTDDVSAALHLLGDSLT